MKFSGSPSDTLGQALEARSVGRRVGGNGVVGVHPFDGFAAQAGDVLVAERNGRGYVFSGVEQFSGVDFLTADLELCESPCRAGCGDNCRRK